ncbi:hypothetical protein VUR80DRAFT_7566 [Thermomyces stellatus]
MQNSFLQGRAPATARHPGLSHQESHPTPRCLKHAVARSERHNLLDIRNMPSPPFALSVCATDGCACGLTCSFSAGHSNFPGLHRAVKQDVLFLNHATPLSPGPLTDGSLEVDVRPRIIWVKRLKLVTYVAETARRIIHHLPVSRAYAPRPPTPLDLLSSDSTRCLLVWRLDWRIGGGAYPPPPSKSGVQP